MFLFLLCAAVLKVQPLCSITSVTVVQVLDELGVRRFYAW